MNTLVEIGRFFVTALAVTVSSVVPMAVLGVISGDPSSFGPFLLIVVGITFVIAVIAGVLVGLPLLLLAKKVGWSDQPWKMSILGLIAGIVTVGVVILFASDGIAQSEVWKEVFPPYAAFGGFGGFIAALSWFWLHRNDEALTDA